MYDRVTERLCPCCRFCPSVFFYLLCLVPAIWFLELDELDKRIHLKNHPNATAALPNSTAEEFKASIDALGVRISWLLQVKVPRFAQSDCRHR